MPKIKIGLSTEDKQNMKNDILSRIDLNSGPKGAYATVNDLEAAHPKGADGIYIVKADGYWYYWNGSQWVSGTHYIGVDELYTKKEAESVHTNIKEQIKEISNSLNEILDGADDKFNTFKEISDQITKFEAEHKELKDLVDKTTVVKDIEGSKVEYTALENVDTTLKDKITSLIVTIPNYVGHGFYSTINFINGGETLSPLSFKNNSAFTLRVILNGVELSGVLMLHYNTVVRVFIECDGLFVYVMIQEVVRV